MILYQDEFLVVVAKPAGLVVHRGWARDKRVLMTEVRDALGTWVYPVHRLDRGASGTVLFALSSEIASSLGKSQQRREIHKRYFAIVRGRPDVEGVIDSPLTSERGGEPKQAETWFRCLETVGRYSLVEAVPRTGRLHQIRRHFKRISCPLIGDVRYGKGEHNRIFRSQYELHRLALHAHQLDFLHPVSGQRLSVRCRPPEDLTSALRAAGFADPAAL